MSNKLRAMAFASLAVAVVMVPLYGDPRRTPVSHPEWARMLLRALEMEEAASTSDRASQVFATLAWKTNRSLRPEQFVRASGVEVQGPDGRAHLVTGGVTGEAAYRVSILKGGNYGLRAEMAGNPATPVKAEITATGQTKPAQVYSLPIVSASTWVDGGTQYFGPGAYTLSLLLPPGTRLDALELVPPCLSHIEPQGGWKAGAITDTADVAVTALKAMDLEYELPPAATPVELSPTDFLLAGATALNVATGRGSRPEVLKAGAQALEASVNLDIKEAGLYTLYAFGVPGEGQSWVADSCRKAVICPSAKSADQDPRWRPVLTAEFTRGRHSLALTLGRGGSVERLRVERKKDGPADYVGTLRRLGFEPGPDGPITRERAVEAMRFIRAHRVGLIEGPCGDVQIQAGVATTVAGGPGFIEPEIPGPLTPGPPTGNGLPPVGGTPVIPRQQPASPTVP